MKIDLTKGLIISFVLVVFVSLLATGIITTYMIDSEFDVYLLKEHQEKIDNILSIINSSIKKNPASPDFDGEGLTRYAILENYFIQVRNLRNEVIYTTGKSHLIHNQMMGPMMMRRRLNKALEEYKEKIYTLELNNNPIGEVIIGYFGPSNISREALTFKGTLYKSILVSSIFTIILATIISIFVSKQLSIPIKRVTKASKEIARGNLSHRVNANSRIKEIFYLNSSINHLGKALEKQEALRKRLTSDMAHEIRTPLTTIKSHIEAFLDKIWEPTPERLKDCYDEVNRLSNLVENIENIHKLEMSDYILNKTYFNMDVELKSIVNTLKPQLIKKNLALELNNNINQVFLDKDRFRQIMFNLLTNALKYSYENSKIIVNSYEENNNIIIKVIDFGIGISQEDLPHIFEHLYRGDSSRTRETGGSGIGLSITKTLVEAHGGTISVKSKIGEGSTFTIRIPMEENI